MQSSEFFEERQRDMPALHRRRHLDRHQRPTTFWTLLNWGSDHCGRAAYGLIRFSKKTLVAMLESGIVA